MSTTYVPYWEKPKDPRWQKRRLEIMQRDDFTCIDCGDSSSSLNVHHCFYIKSMEPWEYPDDMLKTLCEQCHKKRHQLDIHIKSALCFVSSSIIDLVAGFAAQCANIYGNAGSSLSSTQQIVGAAQCAMGIHAKLDERLASIDLPATAHDVYRLVCEKHDRTQRDLISAHT